MGFIDEWLELIVILLAVGALIVMGATAFNQNLDKARLTLSVAALNKAQSALKNYRATHHTFPASLDFTNCSDQEQRIVVLGCAELKADIDSFVSYNGTAETFVLKAKAKDKEKTLITVTELTTSF